MSRYALRTLVFSACGTCLLLVMTTAHLMAVLRAREAAGLIRLLPKPPARAR